MNPYYESRPPKTAAVSRKIWDMVTELEGREPLTLWKNWNGIVFGCQMSDADYGDWKYTFSKVAIPCGSVPEYILVLAGSRLGNKSLADWYREHNPEALSKIDADIKDYQGSVYSWLMLHGRIWVWQNLLFSNMLGGL